MSNPEEKKWIACCFCDYKCETEIEMSKHRCKPSTSQSCEHDKGTIWRTETGNGGFGVCSKVVPCPFCKPTAVEPEKKTICSHDDMPLDAQICPDCGWLPYCAKPVAVEPSVESIAFALVHKFSIYTEDGTFFTDNEPNEPKKLELLIAEALRNERNRHG